MRKVAVVGAGLVGERIIKCLRKSEFFGNSELKVLARSSREQVLAGELFSVKEIKPERFEGIDFAFFAGTEGEKGASLTYAKEAIERGAIVIDNGADFRLNPEVPLVVPEINPEDLNWHKGLISSPNCSTIQMVMALWPIYREIGIKRIIASTYQAASGAGGEAERQLIEETKREIQGGEEIKIKALPHRIAFNVFPQVGKFEEFGYTTEEWKMVRETRKIFHDDKIKITTTTVRVPVPIGHSEAIYIETKKQISCQEVKEILMEAPGIKVIDNPEESLYPMPIDCVEKDEVFVGRIRRDPDNKKGLWLWVVSDNLWKGAALNTVQIGEEFVKRDIKKGRMSTICPFILGEI